MKHIFLGLTITIISVFNGASSLAVTLEEYGVEITSSGVVDTTTGLKWLSADLTLGTPDAIDELLNEGWRIPGFDEAFYLLTRMAVDPTMAGYGDPIVIPLVFDDFTTITSALGIGTDGFNSGSGEPWLCGRLYESADCQVTTNWVFTPFTIVAEPEYPDLGFLGDTYFWYSYYITDVPIYSNYEIGVCDTCVGRVLLVRNVPLPAGIWLLLSALAAMQFLRGSSRL